MNRDYLEKQSLSPYDAGTTAEPRQSRSDFINTFRSLPSTLQNFLASDETSEAIADLSEYFDLDAMQTELTAWAIRNVTVGYNNIKELPGLISRMTDLDIKKSTEISSYIIKNIIAPYWEDIKKIQIQNFGLEQAPPTQKMKYPGEDLPETGGNIINLRQRK